MGSCSIHTGKLSIQLMDFLNVVQSFSKKGYPFDNVCCECFSNISRKKKQTANVTILCKSCSFRYLSTSKDTTIRKDRTTHLICLLQTKRRSYTGSKTLSLLLSNFILFVSTYLTIVQPFISNNRINIGSIVDADIIISQIILHYFPHYFFVGCYYFLLQIQL